jgi:hypothetical protein
VPTTTSAALSSTLDTGSGYTVRIPTGWKLGEDNGGADKDVYLESPCGEESIYAQGPLTTANGHDVKDLNDFADKHLAALEQGDSPAKLTTPPHTARVSLGGSPTLEYTLDDKEIQFITFRDGAGYVLDGTPSSCTPDIDATVAAVASSWQWT